VDQRQARRERRVIKSVCCSTNVLTLALPPDYTRVMNPMHASPNLKRSLRLFFLAAAMVISALIDARPAAAATYDVNLSFTGGGTASLVGTVDLPLGNYTIMNGAPNPFTAINLTLTVNGTPFSLVQADLSLITGTGQFLIDANASTLIFNTLMRMALTQLI
jgi:hypothetical protein